MTTKREAGERKKFRVSLVVEVNGDPGPEEVVEEILGLISYGDSESVDCPPKIYHYSYDCTAEEID
jgi:hypothetical protein